MVVASAEIHQAIYNVWTDSGIDAVFRSYWSPSDKTRYPSLNDSEASPHQPFPYCVFLLDTGDITDRMTGHSKGEIHQIRDMPLSFTIYTKSVSNYSAKELAAILMETVLSRYGGHPTIKPETLSIALGEVLLQQFIREGGSKIGDDEYRWLIEYNLRVDSYFRTQL